MRERESVVRWKCALERKRMKVSHSKMEYMCVNICERIPSGMVRPQRAEIKKVEDFKYLGSTVQSNGDVENR